MSKDLVCQTCKKSILCGEKAVGFYHDKDTLAMRCGSCNGLVFPTTKQEEEKSRNLLKGANNYNTANRDLIPIKIDPKSKPVESQNYVG